MSNTAKAIAAAVLAAFLFGSGWLVNGWRLTGQHAQELAQRDQQALALAEASKQIGIRANEIIAAADAKGVKGIADAKAETERMRRCIAAGTCGVWIKSSAADGGVPGDSTPSSLGNAASGITGEAVGRVLDLWDAVDADAAKLDYLQTYADQCWRAGDEASKLSK